MRCVFLLLIALVPFPIFAQKAERDATELIHWLLQDDRDLHDIPFPVVVHAVSGKSVLPIEPQDPVLDRLADVFDQTLAAINDPAHPIHQTARINEASAHIEKEILTRLQAVPEWQAGIPLNEKNTGQRPGYPDIRLDVGGGRIFYLDPKLYSEKTRDTTLRTFYFEPKKDTNKIRDDAVHLLIGWRHNEQAPPDRRFEHWEIIDLSHLRVRLKAEFQASNREIYIPEAILRQSGK